MSRPQKIHPPIKASFTQIINAIADGRGVSPPKPKNLTRNQMKTKPKKAAT
jgi:hypothetical protein